MSQAFVSDDDKFNRHLEDVLKKVQKQISGHISWLLVDKGDRKILKDLRERFPKKGDIKWVKATDEDIKTTPNIKSGFIKTQDDITQRWIFKRPCQQTIEWRSTLIDFIRFEKIIRIRSTVPL